jgi:hypothetical protein
VTILLCEPFNILDSLESSEWNEIEKEVELRQSREIESWNEFEREVRLRENEVIGSEEEEPTSEGNYDDRWDELEGEVGLRENEGIESDEEEPTSKGNSVDQEYTEEEQEMKAWSPGVWRQLDEDLKRNVKVTKAKSEK